MPEPQQVTDMQLDIAMGRGRAETQFKNRRTTWAALEEQG